MDNITTLSPPIPGEICSINDAVLWCRMPLPLALDHINVYLVRDNGGWAIIDCGMATKATKAAWADVIAQLDVQLLVCLSHICIQTILGVQGI